MTRCLTSFNLWRSGKTGITNGASLEELGLKALELSISDKSVMMFRLAISEGHKNGGKLGQIFIEQSFNGAIKVLSDYIRKKQLEGVFKTMNPQTAATRFFLMIKEPYGFIMLITGQKPEFSEEQKIKIVRDAVDFFLLGIAAR
ncbi:MAG: TetR/AcrR family transcriptional regulator C-terminal domain-containing protein [Helicobacteraceae bacterium]|nr:TetR/AcrR family transcriptional regulator C-terminal domain-containing protein [Helicobacteraceae bacterium]